MEINDRKNDEDLRLNQLRGSSPLEQRLTAAEKSNQTLSDGSVFGANRLNDVAEVREAVHIQRKRERMSRRAIRQATRDGNHALATQLTEQAFRNGTLRGGIRKYGDDQRIAVGKLRGELDAATQAKRVKEFSDQQREFQSNLMKRYSAQPPVQAPQIVQAPDIGSQVEGGEQSQSASLPPQSIDSLLGQEQSRIPLNSQLFA